MDPKKIQAITDWSTLQTISDMQCVLGFANFYCILIKNYSQVATPLTQLTCKDKLEFWNGELRQKKLYLKFAFRIAPILIHLDFYMDIDTSNFVLGAILSQIEEK